MKKIFPILLCMAAVAAWAEESPAPTAEKQAPAQPTTPPALKDHKTPTPAITLKQLKPKETISLDEAVDMPSDI